MAVRTISRSPENAIDNHAVVIYMGQLSKLTRGDVPNEGIGISQISSRRRKLNIKAVLLEMTTKCDI